LQRGNFAFQEGIGFGQFATQPGFEPLRLTVVLLSLSFWRVHSWTVRSSASASSNSC
jgi:hypothetical protein